MSSISRDRTLSILGSVCENFLYVFKAARRAARAADAAATPGPPLGLQAGRALTPVGWREQVEFGTHVQEIVRIRPPGGGAHAPAVGSTEAGQNPGGTKCRMASASPIFDS